MKMDGRRVGRSRGRKMIWMVWEETKQAGEEVAEGIDLIS
jgi:hypothetical protein